MQLRIEAQFGNFIGQASAWVERDAMTATATALRDLDAARAGRAQLASMSPGEFSMSIATTDRSGHLLLTASLCKRTHVSNQLVEFRVAGAFEIDNGKFAALANDFAAMATTGLRGH